MTDYYSAAPLEVTMRHPVRLTLALGSFALALAVAPAPAQLVADGGELAMSGRTDSKQFEPTTALRVKATDPSLSMWDDDVFGVVGRFYDASGTPLLSPITIAADQPPPTTVPFVRVLLEHHDPSLAMKPDGSFVVAWTELTVQRRVDFFIDEHIPLASRIVARTFNANGTPKGNLLEIGKGTGAAAGRAVAVASSDGSSWIAWEESGGAGDGVHLRVIDKKGKLGKAAFPARGGRKAALAAGGSGMLLAWEGCCAQDGAGQVFGLLYKSNGKAIGGAFGIPTTLGRRSAHPAVAGRPGGDFLVAWEATPSTGGGPTKVYARIVLKTGALAGGELAISGADAGSSPRAAALAGARWGVAWVTRSGLSRTGVAARTSDGLGNLAAPVTLSQAVPRTDDLAFVGVADGRVLAEWVGVDTEGRISIRGRRAHVQLP
jgi:hypothetical protein